MGGDGGGASPASASIMSSTQTMVANLVGAGLLSLPYTMLRAGLVPGIVAMVVMTLLCGFSAILIARCCEMAGQFTYKGIAVAALGPRAATAVTATLVLYTLGSCVAFSVLVGDFLPDLVKFFIDRSCPDSGCSSGAEGARDVFGRSEVMVVLAGSCFLYPLSLQRNLDGLKFTSGALPCSARMLRATRTPFRRPAAVCTRLHTHILPDASHRLCTALLQA